ncbi:TolC family protein [Gaetbulibacter saemankumensis]|uniref:TolC family protein n=1 Tax=Gaetbulibacter saemankumensis TaxID=311208 RepID=UPI000482EAD4|nr:TolC family protein [Gaetbulibacter saemankumensis]
MKQFRITTKIVMVLLFSTIVSLAQAQELEFFMNEAVANNLEIKKFEAQYQQASEKTNEVQSIPNTEFGLGYFVSEPETRTGAQRFKVSAKQMLPWFGSITARENYVGAIADAKYVDIVIAKRKLIASVAQSYYRLQTLRSKQQVLRSNIELLEIYETLALNAVETGKASAVDVLRLQMRQNNLVQLQEVLEQQFLAEQSEMNALLNRDKSIGISLETTLDMPLEALEISTENLSVHPELTRYDKLYESVEQSELLNQKERSPMIGFGVDFVNVEKRPGMDFIDNGKDIFMPMLSLSIPIFNKSYNSKSKQNALQQEAINYEKETRHNRLQTLLDKAITEKTSAQIQYRTQAENLMQAKDAETILMKNYESGTLNFGDVLDIQELQLQFEMDQVEAVKNYYIQSSIINYLTS